MVALKVYFLAQVDNKCAAWDYKLQSRMHPNEDLLKTCNKQIYDFGIVNYNPKCAYSQRLPKQYTFMQLTEHTDGSCLNGLIYKIYYYDIL